MYMCSNATSRLAATLIVLATFVGLPARGQTATTAPADEGFVQLNLPPVVELKVLIEYVSKRLNVNIIYDEGIGSTRVAIVAPAKIKNSDVLPLLKNALKMAGLELVDSPQTDWKVIGRKATIKFVTARNVNAVDLAKRVGAVLDERDRINGGGAKSAPAPRVAGVAASSAMAAGSEVALVSDPKSNQIGVVATASEMTSALALIDLMDVPSNLETRTYRLRHINPQRIDNLMRNRAGGDSSYSSIMDEQSGLLLVTASPAIQKQIAILAKELDVEADPNRSSIQFYKLVNTTAADVLQTIRTLQGTQSAPQSIQEEPTGLATPYSAVSAITGTLSGPNPPVGPTGPNYPSSPGLAPTPPPPALQLPTSQPAEAANVPASVISALGRNAVVSSDQNTNTIIVVAPPDVQRVYKQLIETLDKRRPQVLVEVTLVSIDDNGSLNVGVELSKIKLDSEDKVLVFSAFGLSSIDPKTGAQTINPTPGFNGALISPGSLNVIIKALATEGHARVLSAPKILMNDNATGTLASIAEAPFTSVNASSTVSTTSFAGYAQAGTTVTITPHISQGDYLQLKYSVALNSFTSESNDPTIPPPRQTDTVGSEVTVPDGYAVIVGGLTRKDFSRQISKIPLLGDVPILKFLFSSFKDTDTKSRLYVFIRPVILRDDKFEDLKFLSERDLAAAQLPSNYPTSDPIIMR